MERHDAGATIANEDLYYLQQELDSVAGLVRMNGQLAEMVVYDTYGNAEMVDWPRFDDDRDADVDVADTSAFYLCMNGPGQSPAAAGCEDKDENLDGDVDVSDYAKMMSEFGGPSVDVTTRLAYSVQGNPFLFTGRLTDTLNRTSAVVLQAGKEITRLQDNRNRTYDPKHGRWLQRDPLGVREGAGQVGIQQQYFDGINLYQYVRSRTTTLLDPSGTLPDTQCYLLIDLVAQWAARLGRPCTQKIVNHFLYGGGTPLSCPGECSSVLKPIVQSKTQEFADSRVKLYSPCVRGRPVSISTTLTVPISNAGGDLGSSIGKFTMSLEIKGRVQCVKKLSWGGLSTQCCRLATAIGNGTVDDWIDYDKGKAGSTPLARLLNDCAAFLEATGIGKPFMLRGCHASGWGEAESCP